MKNFSLSHHLSELYADRFPQKEGRPVIGITGNYGDQTCKLGEGYYKQIIRAGGTPFILPPTADQESLLSALDHIDALLLSGGADINPLYCGEEPSPRLGGINAERDLPELLLARLAFNRQMPVLGICRGIQTMAVALGGKVAQDLDLPLTSLPQVPSQGGGTECLQDGGKQTERLQERIKHSQEADRSEPTHSVALDPASTLYNIYKVPTLFVNSFHHQAVSEPGAHFRVAARAKDGVIEAIESSEEKPMIGVQWHPECMGDDHLPLFQWLVGEAHAYRKAHQIHDRILSLDTHCDTPMFFPQHPNFATRDDKILVDLPKMTEGRLDATIMVCYLPQTYQDNKISPKAYADLIFDKIGDIITENNTLLAQARTPEELWHNKLAGKKSIMLGIENGLALEGNPANVGYFRQRGVVYITLCHNGDNDICDSARGSQTHGGVSPLGAEIIAEMNRQGVMVDLSHAAESSFYDALQISRLPIVCSHSSARALCDHPRNLTDDQMRALAKAGGVCQVTLYHGFLVKDSKTPSEASILDAMAHLDHAIRVMGIDYVGLGTDFDGDGGVSGLADASELTLFTRQLMKRRYSEADIQKIWGGNFLRVMKEVQSDRQ